MEVEGSAVNVTAGEAAGVTVIKEKEFAFVELTHTALDAKATLTESPLEGFVNVNVESEEAIPAGIPFTNH